MAQEPLTGLSASVHQRLIRVFTGFPKVEKVILYGSRAKGVHQPSSDIDLTLLGPELTLKDQFRIEEALDDLLLPVKIDCSVFDKIDNPALREHIERVGKVVYEREEA